MRLLSLLSLIIFLLISACNNNKKQGVTITSEDGKEKVTVDPDNLQKAAEEMQNRNEELKKLKPLTLEELKAMIPAELMGAKQSDYNAVNYSGTGQASAKYKIDDSTKVELTVIDCAGPAGAGIYSMRFLMNFEQDNDREYTKTTEFKGNKAIENCKKTRNDCSFTYFSGDRFMVVLNGDNVGIDKLKDIAGSLNIK
jgi:hypothetical protein